MESTHSHNLRNEERQRLQLVLAVTILYFVVELAGGWFANSLALLSDAVHMLTDIAALCLGLFTLWISSRPATAGKTYGYLRAEILLGGKGGDNQQTVETARREVEMLLGKKAAAVQKNLSELLKRAQNLPASAFQ